MFRQNLSRRRLIALAGAGALGLSMGISQTPRRASAQLASQYELIDLGVSDEIGDTTLGFNDMNGAGVVVGNMDIDGSKNSPFVFKNGKLTRIKTGEFGARASCINNHGVIGGRDLRGWHTAEQPWGFPALWINGEKEVLPFPDGLPSPGEQGRVNDINDNGVAVGEVSIAGGVTVPVIWRNGEAAILDGYEVGGRGTANYINNSELIIGDLTSEDDEGGGVAWTRNGIERLTFAGDSGARLFAFGGLDEEGRVLGTLVFDGFSVAACVTGSGAAPTMLAPGLDGETHSGIYCSHAENVFGGWSNDGDKQQAFVWENGLPIEVRTMVKNTKGLRLEYIARFADDGSMAGNAIDKNGARHPFLLIPA